jgi:hypothetical protein
MIEVSDVARAMLTGSFVYDVRVDSWLGDELLAEDIPVDAGSEDSDRSLNVPERVVITVPRVADGFNWSPTSDTHPLAAAGQVLKVSLGIGVGSSTLEWFQRGEFLITESEETDQGTVEVTCAGLLTLIQEANFVAPFQPTGTIVSTLRALVEPAVTVDVDSAPTDRSVPVSAVNWDSDRLGSLYELLDAWPAVALMNEQGYLEVLPDTVPVTGDAVRHFTDQPGTTDVLPTVVSAVGASTRDGGFNIVVASGYAADGSEVRGIAYVSGGPWDYGDGPANPLPVPFGYSSPLMTSNAQCDAAAQTVLRRKMRQAVQRRFTVTCSPDPTLQLGDPVLLTNDEVTALLCTVEALTLPYKPGTMVFTAVSVA